MEYVSVQGESVPAVGLGTWRLTGDACFEAVSTALDAGYRHLDTAQAYGNERQVGEAVRASDVDREDVFLTTKLSGGNRAYDDVMRSVQGSLAKLGTSYLDLLLIHNPNRRVPLAETLDAMDELVEDGTVRHVGVSNFGVDRLDEARSLADAPIFTDQVQFHPFWDQTDLLDYCAIHDVLLTAYSPLGHGGVLTDTVVREVADAHGKSPAQVALRWALQHENVVAIPKATSREHIEANLDVFDFELTDEEVARIRRPSKVRTVAGLVRSRLPF
ncbi:aldo/keto reductase [Halomarina litorea]|uniref:aldo/keto reductase n=1 Tax=Halomarina litorea TaxID=2961595 RepID=UPI0020C2E54A|nr:aldo/keto reductase [Halomarina sp. BCD28]